MRLRDVIGAAASAMWRQRGRTVLSVVGVVVGSLIMIVSLAAQRGIKEAVTRVFSVSDEMRRILVYPNYATEAEIPPEEIEVVGEMSDKKRQRLRRALIDKWKQSHPGENRGITRERLEELKSLAHVVRVLPDITEPCWAVSDSAEQQALFTSLPADHDLLRERITAGRTFTRDDEQVVLVSEMLAYLMGAASDSEVGQLVGKTVRLEFRHREENVARALAFHSGRELNLTSEEARVLSRGLDRLPGLIAMLPLPKEEKAILQRIFPEDTASEQPNAPRMETAEYVIGGVFRGATEEEERAGLDLNRADGRSLLVLPMETATDLYYRLVEGNDFALDNATVVVDDENQLKEVAARLRDLGYEEYSLIRLVEHIQKCVDIGAWLLAAVAGIALVVAAVGITNTMIMSVGERTHEIGIMKSVGARDRHVLSIFLVEGALVGLLGAGAAIAIGWGLSFAIDHAIRWILEQEVHRSFDEETVLAFSGWMFAAVLAFASAVTMLAAIVPARRAATISPVAALRHD